MSTDGEHITFEVEKSTVGQRLDQLLSQRFPDSSRSYLQYLIQDGYVLLNGKKTKKRVLARLGDTIDIHFMITPETELAAEDIPLDIIYEDEYMLAINKPPGMVVHPAQGHWSGTFVNALLYHCKELSAEDSLRPGIVHRLDKDTSGILIAAKNLEVQQKLTDLFALREMQKTYLAICLNNPGEGVLETLYGRHPANRKQMAVLPESKRDAITAYKTIAVGDTLSLVEMKPKTGRTHQLRVHMRHLGAPILGDPVYGSTKANATWNIHRQCLHAYTLEFVHPMTGGALSLKAPVPQDMQKLIERGMPSFDTGSL